MVAVIFDKGSYVTLEDGDLYDGVPAKIIVIINTVSYSTIIQHYPGLIGRSGISNLHDSHTFLHYTDNEQMMIDILRYPDIFEKVEVYEY